MEFIFSKWKLGVLKTEFAFFWNGKSVALYLWWWFQQWVFPKTSVLANLIGWKLTAWPVLSLQINLWDNTCGRLCTHAFWASVYRCRSGRNIQSTGSRGPVNSGSINVSILFGLCNDRDLGTMEKAEVKLSHSSRWLQQKEVSTATGLHSKRLKGQIWVHQIHHNLTSSVHLDLASDSCPELEKTMYTLCMPCKQNWNSPGLGKRFLPCEQNWNSPGLGKRLLPRAKEDHVQVAYPRKVFIGSLKQLPTTWASLG